MRQSTIYLFALMFCLMTSVTFQASISSRLLLQKRLLETAEETAIRAQIDAVIQQKTDTNTLRYQVLANITTAGD